MNSQKTLQFLQTHRGAIVLGIIAISLFYWYEIRPIRVYRGCSVTASTDARTLLRSKAEIARGTPQAASYENLMARNMYLRSDYESFLKKCLLYYGMQPQEQAASAEGNSESSTEKQEE